MFRPFLTSSYGLLCLRMLTHAHVHCLRMMFVLTHKNNADEYFYEFEAFVGPIIIIIFLNLALVLGSKK
jgi:hypothetical protein